MASKLPIPEFDNDDVAPLAADGNNVSVDENTIFNTPDPVAASTVARIGKINTGYGGEVQGSFIDSSGRYSHHSSEENLHVPSLRMSMDSDQPTDKYVEDISPGSNVDDESRSSFGIVAVESMSDLSSSILHFDAASPVKMAGGQRPLVIAEETEAETPKMAQLSSADSSRHSSSMDHHHPAVPSEFDAAEADMESMLRKREPLPSRSLFSSAGTGSSQEIVNAFAHMGGMGSRLEQMDSSIHEIQINDDDIRNLDDEFSEIGDFDNTVTNSSETSLQGEGLDQDPGGLGSIFAMAAPPPDLASLDEMYRNMASYDEIDMPMEGSLIVDSRDAAEGRRLGGEGVESVESDPVQ